MLFRVEVAAVHLYVNGLGLSGGFERLDYLFLYGDHTGHYLGQTIG